MTAEEAGPPSERIDAADLRTLVKLMPGTVVIVDADGTIVSANDRVQELFGWDPELLVGESIETLIPERLRHIHRGFRQRYVLDPVARPMGAGLDLYCRRLDGSELPVDISLAPVETFDGTRVVAAIRDASERSLALVAQAQLATIVRSSVDAIISTSPQGRITSWNPAAERMFGYTAGEASEMHVGTLVASEHSEAFEQLLASSTSDTVGTPVDTLWLRNGGTLIDVAISVSALRTPDGELAGFSVLAREVTERKRAEEEVQRLLAEEHRRERWQAATADIRLAMLSERTTDDVLRVVCDYAVGLLDGDAAVIGVREGEDLAVAGFSGTLAGLPSKLLAGVAVSDVLLKGGAATLLLDLAASRGEPAERRLLICAPVPVDGVASVVIVVVRSAKEQLERGDLAMAAGLADLATVALQLGRAREDQERLVLIADRERIARDLHDIVIQRIFAVGMALQGAIRLVRDEEAVARVNAAVDDLDTTIREIRRVIFELEPSARGVSGLRSAVLEIAVRVSDSLGFDPVVRFEGPVDSGVPIDVEPHLLAALHEALSNIVRHARASRASVALSVNDEVCLMVTDDGVGVGDSGRWSGLGNLRERAELLGGGLEVSPGADGGTSLVWRVPLGSAPETSGPSDAT